MVIGPIRRALPHRDKHEAAFRKGGMIREVFLCEWRGVCVCFVRVSFLGAGVIWQCIQSSMKTLSFDLSVSYTCSTVAKR